MPYTIEDAYLDLFNLVPDVAGKAYWQAQIDATGEVFGPGSPTYLEIAAAGANVLKELATNRRMLAPLTNVLYQGNGANRVFNVTFPYIDKSHVIVRVNNVAMVPGIHYTWPTDSTIELVASPGLGVTVHIYRDTPITDRFVDFQDGSAITERDLDLSNTQLFDSVQEVWDETQRIGSLAQQVISTTQGAVDGAKRYAGLAYQYERQAFDHMENARDADDRTKVFSNLAGTYADDAKLAAEATEADRAEVATKAATVTAKADQVAFTKSQIDAQVGLVNATLASASQIANSANTAATAAQTTAAQVQTTVTSLQTTAATLQSQQAAALAAKDDAIAAKNLAVTAKTDAQTAATQAAADKTTVTNAAAQVATDAAAVATAKTATETARDATLAALALTEDARDEAVAAAATVDVSTKADITYVDTQLATKASSSSLAVVATTGSYSDLNDKPAIPTNNNQLTNGANYITAAQAPVQLGANNFTGKQAGTQVSMANYIDKTLVNQTASGALTFDLATADVLDLTLSGNVTGMTLNNVPTLAATEEFTLVVRVSQGGTAYSLAWFTVASWLTSGGTAPAAPAANKTVEYVFTKRGTNGWIGRKGAAN